MIKKLFLLLLLMINTLVSAQTTIIPNRYWTFNGPSAVTDSVSQGNLDFTTYGCQYTINTNGKVSKYITLNELGGLISAGSIVLNTGVSVEFLLKPGSKFNNTKLIQRNDGAFIISFNYPTITFSTSHKSSNGTAINDDFTITLDGVGRKSYGYYVDGNWHHFVFKFNATTGTKEIWVDGQLPSGFSKVITAGTYNNTNGTLYLNHSISYVKYFGSLDEVAIYNTAIPSSLIYKHYLGIQSGLPYSFTNDYTGNIPTPDLVTAAIDTMEYAPGHPNVTMLPMNQLEQFPLPRYKPNNTLLRLVDWADPKFIGGGNQSWSPNSSDIATNSSRIQLELAKNFNYYIHVNFISTYPWDTAWIGLSNRNPSLPVSTISIRGQVPGGSELLNQSKTSNYYLQNSSGTFIDASGNATASKIWRPSASVSGYTNDGTRMKTVLNNLNSLNNNVSLVNENGEIFPHITSTSMALDPNVVADKNASGLDWDTYIARRFSENETQSYRDILLTHNKLLNAKFTEYSIDGASTQYRFKYSEARKVNNTINGQYYSTPDFYPRWPYNWRYWQASWHGWQWIVDSRNTELALNDNLFSPFVAAGWDVNEELNIRPAQWLGLLKSLSVMGAEFYYTGFFSTNSPWPDSRNWIWQLAMPAYAQAITSRYEDILRTGMVLSGDVPNDYTNPTKPGYMFSAGDTRKLVIVRSNLQNKYVISGTIQGNSNMKGNVENEGIATINLNGENLSFNIRRQGSVYIYDKTNASAPVFYQLDGWHENSHPYRWTKDFNLEAELFDNNNTNVAIKTVVPTGTLSGDYTNFTSYISWINTQLTPIQFKINPRSITTYYFWIRAKSIDGSITSLGVQLDNGQIKTIGCISDTNWTWYKYESCSISAITYPNTSIGEHTISIIPFDNKVLVDKIILTVNPNLAQSPVSTGCSSGSATITANGPTTFCDGGNVTLTASAGSSYLWNNGQTTQSIVVTSSGSYYATITNSNCAVTSNTITVTENPIIQATITANGPTSICTGQTVTLTANLGDAYQWSTGELTQSITVSSTGNYVVTVHNNGCKSISAPVSVAVNICTPQCPIPIGLTNTLITANTATLTWNVISQASLGYTVKLRNMNTGVVSYTNVPSSMHSVTISVTPGKKYRWWVLSKCSSTLKSNYSGYVVFNTPVTRIAATYVAEPIPNVQMILGDDFMNESNAPDMSMSDFDIYPNPAFTEANVSFRSNEDGRALIELYDFAGKRIKVYNIQVTKGLNISTIDLNALARGLYTVRLKGYKMLYSKQLAIQ